VATGFLSPVHVALLLVVVLMVFGAKRLPEFGRSLGSGMRGFKRALDGQEEEEKKQLD
jgi:sec-independent protein translocase protein TatA